MAIRPSFAVVVVCFWCLSVSHAFLPAFLKSSPPQTSKSLISGRPTQSTQERSDRYGSGGEVHIRIPNELDSTVDPYVPTLPHVIPEQSNGPLEYLRQLQQNGYNQQQQSADYSSNSFKREVGGGGPTRPHAQDIGGTDSFRQQEDITRPNGQQQQPFNQQLHLQLQLQQQQQLLQLQRQKQQEQQRAQQLQLKLNQLEVQQQQQQAATDASKHQLEKKSAKLTSLCEDKYATLVGDIFMGNEMVPELLDAPPENLLDLTYRTVRTFPGMRVTAEVTRYNPMMRWPVEKNALYTVILSNLDINSRRNRTLAEFWHWFVGNIPEDDIDSGDVIFDLLHPLVLPDGDGDHRFGYFVLKQPGKLDFSKEGGPTDNCSPQMSKSRGPFRSTRAFMKKYNLSLTAATFLVVDHSEASNEIACEWQRCMHGQVFIDELSCDELGPVETAEQAQQVRRTATAVSGGGGAKWKKKRAGSSGDKSSFWYL